MFFVYDNCVFTSVKFVKIREKQEFKLTDKHILLKAPILSITAGS